MAYSFLSLYLTNLFAFIFLLIAAILAVIAASNIITAANAPATTVSNNQTARSLLYGGAVIGFISALFLLLWVLYIWYSRGDIDITNKDIILGARFGIGTIIFLLLVFLLIFFMVFLVAYAVTFIDTNNNDKWLAVAAAAVAVIALIIIFISFFFYTPFNAYLDTFVTEDIKMLAARPMFSVNTDSLETRKFEGKININGKFEQPKEYINY